MDIRKLLGRKTVEISDLVTAGDINDLLCSIAKEDLTDVVVIYRRRDDNDTKLAAAGSILDDDLAFHGMMFQAMFAALMGGNDGQEL